MTYIKVRLNMRHVILGAAVSPTTVKFAKQIGDNNTQLSYSKASLNAGRKQIAYQKVV